MVVTYHGRIRKNKQIQVIMGPYNGLSLSYQPHLGA